jgi:uncharacterized protein (TIGR03435 family)
VSGSDSRLVSGTRELHALIRDAYYGSVDAIDLPSWIRDDDRFAISVKIPPNTNVGTCREMLRNLLAARFHLVTAVETRVVGRWHVKVAKSGLRLKPVDNPPTDPKDSLNTHLVDGNAHYAYRGVPMTRILDVIGNQAVNDARARGFMDDPRFKFVIGVVDETGLTGYYDASFELPVKPPRPDDLAESLEEAVTRQLGLTLEFRKAPGKVLVIRSGDHMPTEN